jgi:hypothetical protein
VQQDRVAWPEAWAVLERALVGRQRVCSRYHGRERVACPHVLGWKNGRAKSLLFQVAVADQGPLADGPRAHWRSMFVDEIEDAVVIEGSWETAENFSANTNCVEVVEVAVGE